jgi:hypothetical protein
MENHFILSDQPMFENKAAFHESESVQYPTEREMVLYMFRLLDEYYRSINAAQDPVIDPLNARVTMKLSNGQTFEIPERIQRYALAQYAQAQRQRENVQTPQNQTWEQRIERDIRRDERVLEEDVKSDRFKQIVTVVLVVVVLYLLYKYFTYDRNYYASDF